MTPMSSTTALNPDYADLPQPTQSSIGEQTPLLISSSVGKVKQTRLNEAITSLKIVYQRNIGLLLVVAAQVFFSLMGVTVKMLNSIDTPVSPLELIVVRMAITFICSITYMLSTGVPDAFLGPKGIRLLLVFRGFSGFFGLFGVYFSLQYLSLSDTTVLTFLAPLCTAAAGALFLGEKFARREAFAGILSLVGVVLVARPPFLFGSGNDNIFGVFQVGDTTDDTLRDTTPKQRLIAVGVALFGVLGSTGAYTSLRAIGKRAHPLHSLVSFSTYSVVVASVGMLVTKSEFILPDGLIWLAMLLMIGVFGFVTQFLLTMGLARETAGRGTLAIYTQIVFATIMEQIFFHVVPSVLSVIGTLIITTCGLYVVLTKEVGSTTDDDQSAVLPRDRNGNSLESGLLEHDTASQ